VGTCGRPRPSLRYGFAKRLGLGRERTNDNAVMHAITEKMTALEMAAVAEYLSGR